VAAVAVSALLAAAEVSPHTTLAPVPPEIVSLPVTSKSPAFPETPNFSIPALSKERDKKLKNKHQIC
jgi:hypothetical protein